MGKVITARGYKAFRGTMRIRWDGKPHEEIYGDWIYSPDGFWFFGEYIYPASLCEIVVVD